MRTAEKIEQNAAGNNQRYADRAGCGQPLFENDGGTVRARMSEAQLRAAQSERFVEDAFGGSLPRFVAAFASRRPLSGAEIAELRRLIDQSEAER